MATLAELPSKVSTTWTKSVQTSSASVFPSPRGWQRSRRQGTRREGLSSHIRSIPRGNEHTSYRRSDERPDPHGSKNDAQSRAHLAQIRVQYRYRRWHERLNSADSDAVQGRPTVQPGGRMHGDPSVHGQRRGQHQGDESVESTEESSERGRQQTACDADSVEHQQQIQRVCIGHPIYISRVRGEVKESKKDAHEGLDSILSANSRDSCGMSTP